MPELPEVEFARGCLARWLVGRRITKISASASRVLRGRSRKALLALRGAEVLRVERHGKWLLIHLDREHGLVAHLGMTGKFELVQAGAPPVRWSRVELTRDDGAVVRYRDPRMFGEIRVG